MLKIKKRRGFINVGNDQLIGVNRSYYLWIGQFISTMSPHEYAIDSTINDYEEIASNVYINTNGTVHSLNGFDTRGGVHF